MPQFDFAHVFWPQLFWLGLSFAVLYFVIVRATLPKLGTLVDARENKISGDVAAARAAKESADAVSAAYHAKLEATREEARAAITAAKAVAAKESEVTLAQAQAGTDGAIAAAEARIATAVRDAEQALRDVAAEGAQAIVARLTGAEVAIDSARAQVDAQIAG
ncbi:MAG: hypothetical protein B7Z39_01685 [Novosphingobium sp. 12-64-8]|nr:MAG: hypothetical protein B7Z39_01685 [Novosphingobium sp. 12-64-8]